MNEEMEVCKWQYLQNDCLVEICEKMGIEAMVQAVPFVCKSWYKTSLDPMCWRYLSFAPGMSTKQIKRMVDRSCGTSVEVVFGPSLGHNEFIYVSERCPKVKVVSLPELIITRSCSCESSCDCKEKDEKVVASVVRNWKNLRHLSINAGFYFEEIITEVATYCENLETLEVGCKDFFSPISLHEVSLITCSLPMIKCLILRKETEISRECLLSLLSGCKELTRVDVRGCFGFDKNDEEILKMASHLKVFMTDGSEPLHPLLQEEINEMFNWNPDEALEEIFRVFGDFGGLM